MVVIGEDGEGNAPTLQYCNDYAEAKGVDPAVVYIDYESRSWEALFNAIDNYAQGSISLPWEAIVKGGSMEYVWNSVTGEGTAMTVLDELLALW